MRLCKSAVVALMTISALSQSMPANADEVTQGPAVPQPAKADNAPQIKEAVEQKTGTPRIALTLAGGGARGAAHIGVLKAFEKNGIRPDLITGNSCGALIGSLYASGMTAAQIEQTLLDGSFKKAFFPKPMVVQRLLFAGRYLPLKIMGMKPAPGLYSGKAIAKFVKKNLPSGIRNIEDTKIPLAITAINVVDTKPHWFSKGEISQAVRASCTVPLLYRTVEFEGKQLVDGGIRENVPTEIAQATGAPIVVAVRLHRYLDVAPNGKYETGTDLFDRVTSILLSEIESKARADVVIEPRLPGMTMRSFSQEDLASAVAEGEAAANKIMPQLKELMRQQRVAENQKKPM